MRAQNMFTDLVIIILLMAGSVFMIPILYTELKNPAVQYYEDKTALDVENAIEMNTPLYTWDDEWNKYIVSYDGATIALMLLVQDEFATYPNRIRISKAGVDDYYVTFNAAYVADKYNILNRDYNKYLRDNVGSRVKKFDLVYPGYSVSTDESQAPYFWYCF